MALVRFGCVLLAAGCAGPSGTITNDSHSHVQFSECDEDQEGVFGPTDIFPTTTDLSMEAAIAEMSGQNCTWATVSDFPTTSTPSMRLQLVSAENVVEVVENGGECYPFSSSDVLIKFDSEISGGLVLNLSIILRESGTLSNAGHPEVPVEALSGIAFPAGVEAVDFWIRYRGGYPHGPGEWQIGVVSTNSGELLVSGSCEVP